jgi:predicted esterase YcpF (UPF0227 family)
LASTPTKAIIQLEQLIEKYSSKANNSKTNSLNAQWYLIGSSLGGYFSCYLATKYNCSTVLVNPAIRPYELLNDYIGEQVNPYTKEVYQVTEDHIQHLQAIEQRAPTIDGKEKNNYLVMVQTGDEVLNYQQAVEKYQHCRLIVQEGGDHSFINFDSCLPTISDYFQLD